MQKHSPEWYERLATLQTGYHYPWRSRIGDGNGENFYLGLVQQHLRRDADVLDSACGHGEILLNLAPLCRSVLGFDRTAPWIDLARVNAEQRGIRNATFVCYDLSIDANGGRAIIPAAVGAFDLLLCSKGPFHWMEDARRVARPGAVLLMLVPDAVPLTPWHALLPEALRWQDAVDPNWARPAVERRLALGGLTLHSWWSFDVPEVLPDAEQLYVWLSWGYLADEVPSFENVRPMLDRIFAEHRGPDGVAIRHKSYVWKALIPD